MILQSSKKWEFRKNPAFGNNLARGDILFLVSTFKEKDLPSSINCMCIVREILRGKEMIDYFKDKKSNHWLEAGCNENSPRDWAYFHNNILTQYATAIRIQPIPIIPAVQASSIVHKHKNTPWKGTGFTPAENLKRFSIDGEEVVDYFFNLSKRLSPAL